MSRSLFLCIRISAFFVFFLFSSPAKSISENELLSQYENLLNFRNDFSHSRLFENHDRLKLHYRQYSNPSLVAEQALIIFPGTGYSEMQYLELAYDLSSLPLDIYVVDHRGHGLSDYETVLEDDGAKIHVESFDAYMADGLEFLDRILNRKDYQRVHLFGHSLGAHIVMGFLTEVDDPRLGRVVLSSPLLGAGGRISEFMVHLYVHVFDQRRYDYAFRGRQNDFAKRFSRNTITHSPIRYEFQRKLFEDYPHLSRTGPTNHWSIEMVASSRNLLSGQYPLEIPILILQAGHSQRAQHYCQLNLVCEVVKFAHAHEDVFLETDRVRNDALELLVNHIQGGREVAQTSP